MGDLLKSDNTVQNSFEDEIKGLDDSQGVKGFTDYVKSLISLYIQNRYGIKDESDVYKVNEELVRQLKNDFDDLLNRWSQQISDFTDLDQALEEVYKKENVNSQLMTEINQILITSLKQRIREKIIAKIKDNLSITSIQKVIKNLSVAELNQQEITDLIDGVLKGSNPEITNARKEFGQSVEKYRDRLFEMVKTAFDNSTKKIKIQPSNPPSNFSAENNASINTGNTEYFDREEIDNIVQTLTKVNIFMVSLPKKIVTAAIGAVKGLVKRVFNVSLWLFTGLFLKPIHFMLTKSFSIIGGLTKRIFSITKKIFQKTRMHFLLLTPQGMYALGFLIGFIWQKIKDLLPDISFSLSGMISLFKTIFQQLKDIVDLFQFEVERFLYNHPKLASIIESTYDNIKDAVKTLVTDGFSAFLEKTVIGRAINKSYRFLTQSFIFKVIKTGFGLIVKVGKFLFEHPLFTTFLFGTSGLISKTGKIVRLASKLKFGVIHGFVPVLLGIGASEASEAVTKGIIEMFKGSRDNDNESAWNLNTTQNQLLEKISYGQDRTNYLLENLFGKAKEKFLTANKFIIDEYNKVQSYESELNLLSELNKQDDFKSKVNGDLYSVVPNLMERIKNSNAINPDKILQLNNARRDGDIGKQIQYLREMLIDRVNALDSFQDILNRSTAKDIARNVDMLVDDNMNFNEQSSSRYSSYAHEVAKEIQSRAIQQGVHGIQLINNEDYKYLDNNTYRMVANILANGQTFEELSEIIRQREYLDTKKYKYGLIDTARYNNAGEAEDDAIKRMKLLSDKAGIFSGAMSHKYINADNTLKLMVQYGSSENINKLYQLMKDKEDSIDFTPDDFKKIEELRQKIYDEHKDTLRKQIDDNLSTVNSYIDDTESEIKEFRIKCKDEIDKLRNLYPNDEKLKYKLIELEKEIR